MLQQIEVLSFLRPHSLPNVRILFRAISISGAWRIVLSVNVRSDRFPPLKSPIQRCCIWEYCKHGVAVTLLEIVSKKKALRLIVTLISNSCQLSANWIQGCVPPIPYSIFGRMCHGAGCSGCDVHLGKTSFCLRASFQPAWGTSIHDGRKIFGILYPLVRLTQLISSNI